MCGGKLGVADTLQIFGKLGQETGTKEYKAILALIVEEARETDDHEVKLDQYYKAYQLFQSMMETGFPIEEEIYGSFLKYLIDEGMVQEFYFFSDILREGKPASLPRLAYYEMVLCVRLNNEDKIKQLIHDNAICGGGDKHSFQESYLLALCGSDCRRELLMLLETFDITKASSEERLSDIFKSLGMLSLEAYAKKFLLELKTSGAELATLTNYIYDYSLNIFNLAVEDVVSKIKRLHSEMEMKPTSTQYTKLIRHYCKLLKFNGAYDILREMVEINIPPTSNIYNVIMVGYFREKIIRGALAVLGTNGEGNVKSNSNTFSYLSFLIVTHKRK